MGNEASTLPNGATPGDDDGLAPPSVGSEPEQQPTTSRTGKSLRSVFQRGGGGGGGGGDHGMNGVQGPAHYAPSQNHRAAYVPEESSAQLSVHSVPHPEIGVLYTSENNSRSVTNSPSSIRQTVGARGKVVREGGRTLINAMKNLSLKQGSKNASDHRQENEWETRWDEDVDDDDESDDEEDQKPAPVPVMTPQTPQVHLRPGMDGGHSSSMPMSRPPTDVIPKKAAPVTQDLAPAATSVVDNKSQSAAAGQPSASTPASSTATSPSSAMSSSPPVANIASIPQAASWESESTGDSHASYDKPNVQMFLPLLRVLGKGSFGKVVLVQKRQGNDRGSLFAMKILRKTHLVKRRQIERTRTERKVLSVVDHPFIMKLHYAFQTPDKLYLVLDYCPGGELFFHLSRFRRFPERVARFYAAELLLAIGHLHKRGIIYRDLKPENVLLDADGHVKLGDFGLAKAGIRHPCEGAVSMCGTPEYMAPEVLAGTGHGFCVDYWGLGMLVYEMMTGLPPWYTTDRAKLFRRLKSAPLDIPTYFSPHAANCVSQLLERNPRRRLGVTGIRTAMEQEYFRSINWRALYARRVEAPIRPCESWSPNAHLSSQQEETERPDDGTATTASNTTISPPKIHEMKSHELDQATANFDNTFTKMPVNSDDLPGGPIGANGNNNGANHQEGEEELHENTFLGFTFDVQNGEQIAAPTSGVSRQRLHNQNFSSAQQPPLVQVPGPSVAR